MDSIIKNSSLLENVAHVSKQASSIKAVLISTYELGHQPFGLASPVAWLRDIGIDVHCFDLSLEHIEKTILKDADFVGFYLPMHTATRIAVPVISAIKEMNPSAHLCVFGLYAPMNSQYLRSLGIDSVIGGEFEYELVDVVIHLMKGEQKYRRKDSGSMEETFLKKLKFLTPDRTGLPSLDRYAYLAMPDGSRRIVGYTESSRGCKHLCRHCPIVPVYGGKFMIVQRDVVLSDIRQQITSGAEHITFGDPDFFNGIGHAMKIVRELHDNWPNLTYDVTIKVEHLIKYSSHLPTLQETGCLFVISAVESVSNEILHKLDKGHTCEDFHRVVKLCRNAGLGLNPTFVAFTPWMTLDRYKELLKTLIDLNLVNSVAPVQLAIRLLIPKGSRILELEDVQQMIGVFDEKSLCYPWQNPDFRVDELQLRVEEIVEDSAESNLSRSEVFERIWYATEEAIGNTKASPLDITTQNANKLPFLSEPWYCCAEPTKQQLEAFV